MDVKELKALGPVLLCKARTESYEKAFTSRGFTPYFLQVLDTVLINSDALKSVVQAGPINKYAGVIITSSRAAEAWTDAVKAGCEGYSYPVNVWKETPFYVVGHATEKVLSSCSDLPLAPSKILGAESGNGEALAHFIVSDCSNQDPDTERPPLLYLTGDKNRETLPQILNDAGLSCAKLQVYETGVVNNLIQQLESTIKRIKEDTGGYSNQSCWLVLFAPSTADHVLRILREDGSPKQEPPSPMTIPGFRLVAIGPTTENHLKSSGYYVEVCSNKPDAETLAASILSRTD